MAKLPNLSKQPGLSLPKGNFCNSYLASLFTFSMYLLGTYNFAYAILMTIDSFFSLQLYQSVLNRTLLILGASEVDPHIWWKIQMETNQAVSEIIFC